MSVHTITGCPFTHFQKFSSNRILFHSDLFPVLACFVIVSCPSASTTPTPQQPPSGLHDVTCGVFIVFPLESTGAEIHGTYQLIPPEGRATLKKETPVLFDQWPLSHGAAERSELEGVLLEVALQWPREGQLSRGGRVLVDGEAGEVLKAGKSLRPEQRPFEFK